MKELTDFAVDGVDATPCYPSVFHLPALSPSVKLVGIAKFRLWIICRTVESYPFPELHNAVSDMSATPKKTPKATATVYVPRHRRTTSFKDAAEGDGSPDSPPSSAPPSPPSCTPPKHRKGRGTFKAPITIKDPPLDDKPRVKQVERVYPKWQHTNVNSKGGLEERISDRSATEVAVSPEEGRTAGDRPLNASGASRSASSSGSSGVRPQEDSTHTFCSSSRDTHVTGTLDANQLSNEPPDVQSRWDALDNDMQRLSLNEEPDSGTEDWEEIEPISGTLADQGSSICNVPSMEASEDPLLGVNADYTTLELSVPPIFKTHDIDSILADLQNSRGGYKIHWKNDTTAFAVFQHPLTAKSGFAAATQIPFVSVKPYCGKMDTSATDTPAEAKSRPVMTDMVARRLVAGALGMRTRQKSQEAVAADLEKIRLAKEKRQEEQRLQAERRRRIDDAWGGNS
ncbi:hypothetical protein HDU85_004342 [Gaertneriomyces sp. JEL0708]|nr:hypothetical protein HDU85_004342 [Gaertneriomyces sp. JEL0708]